MRPNLLSLVVLVVVLAACGSQDGGPASEPAPDKGQEAVTDGRDQAPSEVPSLVGTFITTVGEHVIDAGGDIAIHVEPEGGLLNYDVRIRTNTPGPAASRGGADAVTERVSTTGPKDPSIDPTSSWFIYIESDRRYWIHDGASRLTLFEYAGTPRSSEVTMTDLSVAPDQLLAEMPDPVKDRIPAEVLGTKR